MSNERRRIAVAPRPGPCQSVQIRVQDDGTVWAQVAVPNPEGGQRRHTRLFAEAPATAEASERSFQRACHWAEALLDFSKPQRPG